jgi:phytol kinase
MAVIITIIAIFLVLVFNEAWWRKHSVHNEFSRKFVHISVGCFVAFWPFYLSWRTIELLSLAFLFVVLLSQYFKIFKAINSVQRPTWGEILFALSVGLIALITHNKWIYMAALLQMALADGMAAIVGIRYGRKQNYSIFGHTKSLVGTLAFFVTSIIILLGFSHFSGINLEFRWIIGASILASLLENLSVQGLDNLLVPLMTTLLLVYH